jgi:ubiquinone/menaquinone biosynthesis C-methylase UbiE
LTGEATAPAHAGKSGEHDGISYTVFGAGPALLLFPLFLSSAQWRAALPTISRHYTVFLLGGPHLGGVALLEDRAASSSYAAMVHTVLDVMNPAAGETLLEVGAGSGAIARIAARHKTSIGPMTAADINEFLLGEAKALAQRDGLDERIAFASGNAESLPFDDASFDHAFSVTVLEECDADLALGELLRVVKPGGRAGVIVRALDMPYPWNVEVTEEIRRKIELAPALVGPKGVADRSVYARMSKAGFKDLTCFPMLSSFDQIGGPFWAYLESRALSRLTEGEAELFRTAMAQAREAGVLFCSCPHHCVVGRRPVE